MDLRKRGKNIRRFVYDIEEILIRTLKDFSIDGQRDSSHPGVWVDNRQMGTIGLSIRKWISMHGFALNVYTRMEHFSLINPCGLSDRSAVSMSELLTGEVPMEEIMERLPVHFSLVFETRVVVAPPQT